MRPYTRTGGYCHTRGKVTPTRKATARENSPHKTSRAFHDTYKTYMKAANNGLAYQCFTLRGSKRGSKGFTFYSSCAWKIL